MNVQVLVASAAALMIMGCGPSAEEIAAQKEKATKDSLEAIASAERTWSIDPATSTVTWAGTMLGIKTHKGTMAVSSGKLTTKGNTVTGGEFIVDMKLAKEALTDTFYAPDGSKQGTRANLIGHLMSPAFFAADSFPTSAFRITAVNGTTATGDLTVRGKTNPETVTDIVVTQNADGTVGATGNLVFNRQKYGVNWNTGSKDAVLNDNIELSIQLTGKSQ